MKSKLLIFIEKRVIVADILWRAEKNMKQFEIVRHCLLLLGLNLIYALRAKTEERHMSNDPDYVVYANWIDEHGIFRWIRRVPILKLFSYKQNEIAKL